MEDNKRSQELGAIWVATMQNPDLKESINSIDRLHKKLVKSLSDLEVSGQKTGDDVVNVPLNQDELLIILHSLIVRVSNEVALQFVIDSINNEEFKGKNNGKRWIIAAELALLKNSDENLRKPANGRLELYRLFLDGEGLKPRQASERAFQCVHSEKCDCFRKKNAYCNTYIKGLEAFDKWIYDEIDRINKRLGDESPYINLNKPSKGSRNTSKKIQK